MPLPDETEMVVLSTCFWENNKDKKLNKYSFYYIGKRQMGIIKTNKHFFVFLKKCYSFPVVLHAIELNLFSISVNIVHLAAINLESLFFISY